MEFYNDSTLVSEWLGYDDFNAYMEEDVDELYDYLRLFPKESGLLVETYFDNVGSYKNKKHPLFMYFVNTIKDDDFEIMPLLVDETNPILMTKDRVKIPYKDYSKIVEFVKINYRIIVQLANGVITNEEFKNAFVRIL